MILCLTSNPAIDRTLTVPRLLPGEVMRATRVLAVAGGKGLNVARAVRTLGGEPLCAGFLGGHSGRLLAELAEREGLRSAWTWLEAETRTCVIVVDAEAGESTVVNEPGPAVTAVDWEQLKADLIRAAEPAPVFCASGSLPPGVQPEWFAELLRAIRDAGHQVWVDTSGPALTAALTIGGINVKVNSAEVGAVLDQDVADTISAFDAAHELRRRGVNTVALTLGKAGGILVDGAGEQHVAAPRIRAVNAVGSGDSFLAGLVTALTQGASAQAALRWAVAAGAANAAAGGAAQFTRREFEQTLGQ